MRLTGTLTDWKDDKGFGFVTPVEIGTKVFVHVSSFPAATRRPRIGDRLTYELDSSSAKGPRAVRVQIAGEEVRAQPRRLRVATVAALLFLGGLAFGVATDRLASWILLAVLLESVLTFAIYALDKQAAVAGRQRVPENMLHSIGLLGGWPGAAFAQQWLRHKSTKRSFQVAFWLTVAINGVLVAWAASPQFRQLTGFSF